MAQTMFLPTFDATSPDPSPLRMLAFSVAEAALMDPNSPSLSWGDFQKPKKPLWEMLEKAKERKAAPSYNFALPNQPPLSVSIASAYRVPPRSPIQTRSAEPSPTKSSFAQLDQRLPPPEFVPRMSAKEFARQPPKHSRTKSNIDPQQPKASSRKLPSLAQIQARVAKSAPTIISPTRPQSHRRNQSAGSVPLPKESKPVVVKPESRLPTFLQRRSASPAPGLTITPPQHKIQLPSTPPSRSANSTPSPTLSVPIITCTPAGSLVDGDDSDAESVVVFDGAEDERERRGKEMRDRLKLRRRS